MNAILYLLKTGCQWRMIPKDLAPWESVYYYFSKWKNEGVIEELLDNIRSQVRTMSGREESPSLGIIDSRSVKTSHHVDSDRGLDENKKVKGRKHHIIVDTQGNLMAIAVHGPISMTAREHRRSLETYLANSLVSPKSLRMVAIEGTLRTGSLQVRVETGSRPQAR